ncbi:MAG: signal peptidase I [Eggerthellaceae bacterium]|nr:signal peptidase I [Eggerthellaceae bacterium]
MNRDDRRRANGVVAQRHAGDRRQAGGKAPHEAGIVSEPRQGNSLAHNALTVIGVIMCIVLIPLLVMNVILIVKSYTSDEVPSVGGHLPLIVLTDSMYPEIQSGDLIICDVVEPEEVAEGDVIAFFDPAGNGQTIVTHRVQAISELGGQIAWQTKGDANNVEDRDLVPAENLVAVYDGFRIPGLGDVAMFMQTTPGLIVCVVLPLLLLIAYDMVRRRMYESRRGTENDELMRELEELRAQRAAMAAQGSGLVPIDRGVGAHADEAPRRRPASEAVPTSNERVAPSARSAARQMETGSDAAGANSPRRRASHARHAANNGQGSDGPRVR